jgi:hypothetical protein
VVISDGTPNTVVTTPFSSPTRESSATVITTARNTGTPES